MTEANTVSQKHEDTIPLSQWEMELCGVDPGGCGFMANLRHFNSKEDRCTKILDPASRQAVRGKHRSAGIYRILKVRFIWWLHTIAFFGALLLSARHRITSLPDGNGRIRRHFGAGLLKDEDEQLRNTCIRIIPHIGGLSRSDPHMRTIFIRIMGFSNVIVAITI